MSKMEDREWLPQAAHLMPGQRKRGDHDCGDPGTLLITAKQDGSKSAYCFRCGGTGHYAPQLSLAQLVEQRASRAWADKEAQATVELPTPSITDPSQWPEKDKLWWYRMGMGARLLAQLGVYYCPKLQRTVVPLYRDGKLVYWQARSQHKDRPKWINPDVNKAALVLPFSSKTPSSSSAIVLTEDVISAFKVSLVTTALPLLGTKLSPAQLLWLQAQGLPVCTWLDDDTGRRNGRNPGQEAAMKIAHQLAVFGIPHRNVKSSRDPKTYTPQQIKEILS